MKNALILFSHGSLLCGAGEALEAHAERLRARGEYDRVEIGYLNYSEPAFAEAVDRVARAGATRVVVAPYFLVAGFFVTGSLPREMEKARAAHPDIAFVVADAFRHDPGLADALLEAASTARPRARWRDPLQRAAAACRPHPDCPLYETSACPKAPASARPDAAPCGSSPEVLSRA
jgi:sirohydrochlorin cobaltochelatase